MTATLACCWAFAPWRLEAARSAAAWLDAAGSGPLDVVRADLDALAPREDPRPPIDRRLRHTVSLAATDPGSWPTISSYAESAVRAIRTWWGGGLRWESGYSGASGLADHLVLALLRGNGTIPAWTAHLIDLPTHEPNGSRREAPVTDDALLRTLSRLLRGWEVPEPASDQAADWVLALIAGGADRIVVGSPELVDALAESPGWVAVRGVRSRAETWARPPRPGSGRRGPGDSAGSAGTDVRAAAEAPGSPVPDPAPEPDRLHITAGVDVHQLPMLEPVLRALTLLGGPERERIRLTLVTDAPAAVATELRRHGLEDAVPVTGPGSSAARVQGLELVVDAPTPAGLGFSPAPLPGLADAEARGREIILLAEQDSPLTRHPVAHHLPAGHVSAARALLSRLAAPGLGIGPANAQQPSRPTMTRR